MSGLRRRPARTRSILYGIGVAGLAISFGTLPLLLKWKQVRRERRGPVAAEVATGTTRGDSAGGDSGGGPASRTGGRMLCPPALHADRELE